MTSAAGGAIVARGRAEQMTDDHSSMNRRLAAILAADIAGYSRLMGEDEATTVRDLKGHQAAILPLSCMTRYLPHSDGTPTL